MKFDYYLKYLSPKYTYHQLIFSKYYSFAARSQWWSKDELFNYQWKKITKLISHAYRNVPYYQNLFKKIGAKPGDIKTLDDFKRIPFLTKEIVRDSIDEFFPKNYIKNFAQLFTTGGSTGKPLGFYKLPINDIIERAFMLQQWARVGYTIKSSRVIMRGESLADGQIFKKMKFSNNWKFSSYHLSSENIDKYVEKLNEICPEYLHVYPSSLMIFTKLLSENGLKIKFSPKAILCGSENLSNNQRELFETTYHTRVFSWLGLAENTTLASECEFSNELHAWPQHSYVEIFNENDSEIKTIGQIGEIIGTNLHNFVTPFIRYQSGDLATYGGEECKKCNRNFLILRNIEGRIQNKIFLDEHRTIPLTAITFGLHFEAYKKIKAMQIIQERFGEIIIIIDALPSFCIEDENEIRNKMSLAVDGLIRINFVYTSKLKRNKNGKHIYFIQKLNV